MILRKNEKQSIYTRLNRMTQIALIIFLMTSLLVILLAVNVKQDIHNIVDGAFETTLNRGDFSRKIGLLNVRLSTFRYRAHNNNIFLESESKVVEDLFSQLHLDGGKEIQIPLQHLAYNFLLYKQQWRLVNQLLTDRTNLDESINQQLQQLQELLAERIITTSLAGNDTAHYQQLSLLTSSYHEDFLYISKLNAEERNSSLYAVSQLNLSVVVTRLHLVTGRISTLTATEPQIENLGRQLQDSIDYYFSLIKNHKQQINEIIEYETKQQKLITKIMSAMESFDAQARLMATETDQRLRHTVNIAIATILTVFLALIILYWRSHRLVFAKHIQQPLSLLNARLKAFEQGDHNSLMHLERDDEWGDVEIVFNQMIVSLTKNIAALQKSEKRYRDIFNNASDGLFHITVSGKVLKVNRAMVNLFGYSVDFKGAVPADSGVYTGDLLADGYCRPADRERWVALLREHHVVNNFEVEFKHQSGGTFWGSISGHLVVGQNGEVKHIEGAIRDITEQKKAHAALEQLQLYLQNIIDSMPSILIGVDEKMVVTMWNQRAVEESLLAAKDAKGYAMEKVCHLFDFNAFMPKLEKTLKSRQPIWLHKVESKKKTKSGSKRFFDIMIYPVATEGSAGAVIYMIDTTEKLQMEEMMVQSEKMQAIGGLAAGLAHEINNPLAVILQNVQVLDRRLSPNLSKNCQVAEELGTTMETIAEYAKLRGCEQVIHAIAEAGHRAAKIVANIQSFSRSGNSTLIPCSISNLIEKTLDLVSSDHDMRHKFDFKKITIVREFDEVADVHCEPSQIQQVLFSLLKNAAQALVERSEGQEIRLAIEPVDVDHVRLQICDNGMGMAPEVVNRIFDPFYTTQDVGAGFGLGLSIVYFIITHNHNGSLKVKSELGAGSCFEIILPLTQDGDED